MQNLMRRHESWDPFREFENRMNRLFGLTRTSGDGDREELAMSSWAPSCDVSETESEYRIKAELPDVKKDDVRVTLDDNVLTIQGNRREEKEHEGEHYHRRELSYGSFMRRFAMPDDADDKQCDASFEDGVLRVVIKKSKDNPRRSRSIEVH